MNRPILSLLAVASALLVLTGLASVGQGDDSDGDAQQSTRTNPVQRTELTCPRPTISDSGTTWYTAITPTSDDGSAGGQNGSAELYAAPEYDPGSDQSDQEDESGSTDDAEPVAALTETGQPVTDTTKDADAPALTGTAEGSLAPGWTVQQTTSVESGLGRGLMGTSCQRASAESWFTGASTAATRDDYVHLVNPGSETTVVDIELYGPDGRLTAEAGEGITVPGGSSVPVRLSTLTDEAVDSLAVHVTARSGRIGAQVEAVDEERGADWLSATAQRGQGTLVMPGIPGDATSVRLTVFTPAEENVTLDVAFAGKGGTIVPAGNETVSVSSGTVTTVDLGDIAQGETGSLVLTRSDGSDTGFVAAAVEVTRGKEGGEQEIAFIPATSSIGERATVSGNTAEGTELSLTAPQGNAEVEVTISAGSDGGQAVTERYSVSGKTTLSVTPEVSSDTEGRFAITVRHVSGGPVYAARTLSTGGEDGDGTMFTIQTMPDDESAVTVPETEQDYSILTE